MTGERILRSVLIGAVLVLASAGCTPEPPDDHTDAGGAAPMGGAGTGGGATGGVVTGGSATGGTQATGGIATGGRAAGGNGTGGVAVCETVDRLPTQYSTCNWGATGESRCLANGDRCVCWRGVWHCNTNCASVPQPVLYTDCTNLRGTACMYADSVGCACMNNRWFCTGNSSTCPDPSSGITTDVACDNQTGLFCEYPGSDPRVCGCAPTGPADASSGSTWSCIGLGTCPATQPTYPTACGAVASCTYGNVHCVCNGEGIWICDWPSLISPPPTYQ